MSELDLLRQFTTAPAPPSAEARAYARQRLVSHMTRRRRLDSRVLVTAGGLALAAAAAVAVFLSLGTGGEKPASAAGVLLKAAATARAQDPPPSLGPGQYLYTKSIDAYLSTTVNDHGDSYSVLVPHEREIWLNRDGTGWLYQTSGKPRFLSERDRKAWIAVGRPPLEEGTMNLALGNSDGPTSPMASLALPSDPDALWGRLKTQAEGNGNGLYPEMFTLVGDSLRETFTTPEQRAALYEVAARIPGVELVGNVTDSAGRPGIGVAMDTADGGARNMLIFDPETAALLGEKSVVVADGWAGYAKGTIAGEAAYLDSEVVDSLRVRPDGSRVSARSTGP